MGGGDVSDDDVDSSDGVGEEIEVNIRCTNGLEFIVHVDLNSTVEDFKSAVAQKCEIPAQKQRLIYKGRVMKDVQTLESLGLKDNHTVHLVRGFGTATPLDSTTMTDAGIRNTSSTLTNAGSVGGRPCGRADFEADFPELAHNGSGFPETEQMEEELVEYPNTIRDISGTPAIQNLVNNPNTIRDISDTPAIQNLLNNPETLLNLYMNNSQICEIAYIPNDPATRFRRMNIAWNLVIMREMMRNTDSATGNIEFSLEGFNRVRQMYENALLNAATLPGDNRSDLGSNSFWVLLGANIGRTGTENTASSPAPNTNPLPNPWAPPGMNRRIDGAAGNRGWGRGRGGMNSASRPQVIPEAVRYATQLSQLREMGFSDTQENIRALIATAGDVGAAVERLLQTPGQ